MRNIGIVLLPLSIAFLTGCGPKELTPEQKDYVAKLASELSQTKSETESTKQALTSYSSGLIKTLLSTKLEILQTTEALIEQRMLAVESGSPVKVETVTSLPDEALASSIAGEIQSMKKSINDAKIDAEKYTGGLIQSLKLSTIATAEQSLAMLEQRYLVAKYGLNPLRAIAPPTSLADTTPSADEHAPAKGPADLLPAGVGPFGLEAGVSVDIIEKMTGEAPTIAKDSENLYVTSRVPKPNDAFEKYGLVISPTVGLCVIRAVSKDIQTNDYGHQLQSGYEGMQNALSGVYGNPKTYDFLMPSSIWKDANDWMMALVKQDRILQSEWKNAGMKNNISGVRIYAKAASRDKGYFVVEYTFNNEQACSAEQQQKKNSSL